jgi:hypothetical protein
MHSRQRSSNFVRMHEVAPGRWSRASVHLCLAAIACVAALGAACDTEPPKYRLGLRVRDDGVMLRTLARVPEPKPDGTPGEARFEGKRAEELAKIYGEPAPDGSFSGRFTSLLPADLGAGGVLQRRASPLGTVYAYRERMQGKDAPFDALSEVQRGVEDWLALTDGWMAGELGADPAAVALDGWIRERVVLELRELALYGWLSASGLMHSEEMQQRLQQFLLEREYIDANEDASALEPDVLWARSLRRTLQRRGVAVDAELEKELARIDTMDAAFESLARHIVRSDGFRDWLAARPVVPGEAALPPGAVDAFLHGEESPEAKTVGGLFEAYFEAEHAPARELLMRLAAGRARPEAVVDVTLTLPAEPLETNGTWMNDPAGIVWRDVPLQRGSELSPLVYAIWTEPDIEYQVEHFGRTLLQGKPLLDYESWRRDLDAEDRRIWDELVDLLRPGADLRARIEALRLPVHVEPPAELPVTPEAVTTETPAPEPPPLPQGAALLLDAFDRNASAR